MKNYLTQKISLILLSLTLPTTSLFAQSNYKPLVELPGVAPKGGTDMFTYVSGLPILLIAVAATLSIIFIVIGGIQYISTDALNDKKEGRQKIISALGGLILAIASWAILNTINPRIVDGLNFKLNQTALKVEESQRPHYAVFQSRSATGVIQICGNHTKPESQAFMEILREKSPNLSQAELDSAVNLRDCNLKRQSKLTVAKSDFCEEHPTISNRFCFPGILFNYFKPTAIQFPSRDACMGYEYTRNILMYSENSETYNITPCMEYEEGVTEIGAIIQGDSGRAYYYNGATPKKGTGYYMEMIGNPQPNSRTQLFHLGPFGSEEECKNDIQPPGTLAWVIDAYCVNF